MSLPAPRQLDAPFWREPGGMQRRRNGGRRTRYPAGVTASFEEAQELAVLHRRFDCSHYDQCLNTVAHQNWRNFSCLGCPCPRT